MKFTDNLISGALIKRYKRFFVDVKVNNQIITAHCPNSGSMLGLLDKNNKIWISRSNNPKRKLKFTLELINVKDNLVGVNTIFANKIVLEALNNKTIKEFIKFENHVVPDLGNPINKKIGIFLLSPIFHLTNFDKSVR